MPKHAGFAAVLEVRDTVIQNSVRIYHGSGLLPVNVSGVRTFPNPMGAGTAKITYQLFLDAPVLSFQAANNDRIAFRFRMYGSVSVNAAGLGNFTQKMMLATDILARPRLEVVDQGVHLKIWAEDVWIESIEIKALEGVEVPAQVQEFINSLPARQALSELLQTALDQIQTLAPPLFVPVLQQIGVGSLVSVRRLEPKVLDGLLAIGLDLAPAALGVETWGDPSQIGYYLSKSDIALSLNPCVIQLLTAIVRPQVDAAAAGQGASIDDFWMALEDGNFLVGGHASKDSFGASFSMRARIMLGVPESSYTYEDEYGGSYTEVYPGSDDIWLDVYDVNIDEELPWWLYLSVGAACVLLLPLAPVILAAVVSTIDSIRSNIMRGIESGVEGGTTSSPVQQITLPGTSGPPVELRVRWMYPNQNGLFSRLAFKPLWANAGTISGPQSIAPEKMLESPLVYHLTPAPYLYSTADPSVRLRWQVRRSDTNEVIRQKDVAVGSFGSHWLSLDLSQSDWRQSPEFAIYCRVYRPLGEGVEELVHYNLTLSVIDRLDRHHPFLRWEHVVYTPQVTVLPNGMHVGEGWNMITRKSAIHRTDVPGRCRFADRFSYEIEPEYLDELPFPKTEILKHRQLLCDYCFFGGPDKNEPLIP